MVHVYLEPFQLLLRPNHRTMTDIQELERVVREPGCVLFRGFAPDAKRSAARDHAEEVSARSASARAGVS